MKHVRRYTIGKKSKRWEVKYQTNQMFGVYRRRYRFRWTAVLAIKLTLMGVGGSADLWDHKDR